MSIFRFFVLGLVLASLSMAAAAQNQQVQTGVQPSTSNPRSAPAPALSGLAGVDAITTDEPVEDVPQIPALLGGPGSSLALRSEMERSNYLRGGLNVGAAYDDNALLGSGEQVGNTSFSVFPSFAIDQSTSRMRWSLGYGAGLTVNQRLSSRNQGSHALNFDSEFRLSPHVNLRAAEVFSLTSGMFAGSMGSSLQPGSSGGNGTLITPLANTRSSQTVVETNYHFARNDLIGASGSFYSLHYSDVSTGSGSLSDTQTAMGSGFWLHKIFHGDWAGVGYRYQWMTYGPIGETRVHSFSVVNTLTLSRAFTLTAFIGPEYSDNYGIAATGANAGQLASFSTWSTAGGVDLGWQKQRTSLTAGYSRQVSNGSGIVGAVRLENIHGAVRREFLPGWSAAVMATYGDNESLTLAAASTATSIKVTSVGASLGRNIGRSIGFQFEYFHDIQTQSGLGTLSQNYDANRNRFSVTLSYQWAKALGR
jgi:hypothetical protein